MKDEFRLDDEDQQIENLAKAYRRVTGHERERLERVTKQVSEEMAGE